MWADVLATRYAVHEDMTTQWPRALFGTSKYDVSACPGLSMPALVGGGTERNYILRIVRAYPRSCAVLACLV